MNSFARYVAPDSVDLVSPEQADPCLLRADCISKARGGIELLSQVDLKLFSAKHISIVGRSGVGKSTLLEILAGVTRADRGLVHTDARVAFVEQNLNLVETASALSNVYQGAFSRLGFFSTYIFKNIRHKRELSKARVILDEVGLSYLDQDTPLAKLSGGEQKRVALARALMQDPEVLLLDEPTAGLDHDSAIEVLSLIQRLKKSRSLSILSVLHDRSLAQGFADQIYKLEATKLTSLAKVAEIVPNLFDLPAPKLLRQSTSSRSIWTRIASQSVLIVSVAIFLLSLFTLKISQRDIDGAFTGLVQFLASLLPTSLAQLSDLPWYDLLVGLVETVQMAIVGTGIGFILALPLSFLAATNLSNPYISRIARLFLNIVRTIPSLIWALLFVSAVGLGPLAGVLALAFHSTGYLSKFFYEAFENVNPATPDALSRMGASKLQVFLSSIWPLALPSVVSAGVFTLEYNVRAASILGIVDAGGIGFYLKQFIEFRMFPAVVAGLALLLGVVLCLDYISKQLRNNYLKRCVRCR